MYATVDYCGRLLHKFKGRNVNPMICPMIPFLDPASTFFKYPEKNGYRVFIARSRSIAAGWSERR